MLSSKQVMTAIRGIDQPGVAGMAASLRRNSRNGMNGSTLTRDQQALVSDLEARKAAPRSQHVHPGQVAAASSAGLRRRQDEPLSPAELVWLQRLPADPTEVSFDDASRLLALADGVTKPDEKMLVNSIADPVREHHDALTAQANLAAAQQPLPLIPPAAIGALADAIAAENPNLRPSEALNRAGDTIESLHTERAQTRENAIREAQAGLADLSARKAARTSVTAPTGTRVTHV